MSEDKAPPALFLHVSAVYEAMLQRSKKHDKGEEGTIVVYEGRLTALITQELGLAMPRYTDCMQALKAMGCVRQLRRGGGTSPSMWEMLLAPSLDAFMKLSEETDPEAEETPEVMILQQQIRALTMRVGVLEEAIGVR